MSLYTNGLAGLCENLRTEMENYQGMNYAFGLEKKNGALESILHPVNLSNAGVSILPLSDSNGKIKKARVVYKQRSPEADAVTGTAAQNAGVCDTNQDKEPRESIIEIDNAVSMAQPLGFTEAKLRQYCENPQMFMQEWLFDQLRAMRARLNQDILTQLQTSAGKNNREDGGSVPAVPPIEVLTSTGLPRYQGFDEIVGDYENNELNGFPIIVGQGNFNKFIRLQNLSCCNASTPFDVSVQQSGVAFFLDQHANTTLGANEIIVYAPGAAQLVTYNENRHVTKPPTADNQNIVVPDPVQPGLNWDLDFRWDECAKEYQWFARAHYTVFTTFQNDSFPSADTNFGMTGIFRYLAAVGA